MTPQELDILLAQAGSTSLFAKGVGGFVATLVKQVEDLTQALTQVRTERDQAQAELADAKARLAVFEGHCPPPPASDTFGKTDDLPVLQPPSEPPPDKALSPPSGAKHPPDETPEPSLFWMQDGLTLETCEDKLRKILKSSKSKADVCKKMAKLEGSYFNLNSLSHEQKVRLLNRYVTNDLQFKLFKVSDFKNNWRPKLKTNQA